MLGFVGNILGGVLGFFGDVLQGLFGGIVSFFTRIVDALFGIFNIMESLVSGLGDIVVGFISLFTSLFPFLPPEWVTIIVTGLLMTVVGIIVKKKVFK